MQIRQTFWVYTEGDLGYGVRAMLYIADLPRDLGVTKPFSRFLKLFAVFVATDVVGVFATLVVLSNKGDTFVDLVPMYALASSAGDAISSRT